jgi:uncharacterized protein YrzB (UPF0473 family)
MDDMKIFDENGNELRFAHLVKSFIEEKAKEFNLDPEEVALGIDKFSKTMEVLHLEPNAYGGTDVHEIGKGVKYEEKFEPKTAIEEINKALRADTVSGPSVAPGNKVESVLFNLKEDDIVGTPEQWNELAKMYGEKPPTLEEE